MRYLPAALVILLVAASVESSMAQARWTVGGNMGLSIYSGGGGGSAGLSIGPMGEVVFDKKYAIGTELNINTQAGTPVEWGDYFKYYFSIPGSQVRPYAHGGFSLILVTGGPFFGLRFGGGANFPIAKGLSISPDLVLGPVFATGSTVFYFVLRGGIRYDIP